MAPAVPSRDLTRTTLAVLLLGSLLLASFWILQPFLSPLVWAALLVIAGWPALLGLQRRLGNRRGLAIAVTMLLLLLLFVVPITLVIGTLLTHAPRLSEWAAEIQQQGLPPAPAWVGELPLVGPQAANAWAELAAAGPEGLAARIGPYVDDLAAWVLASAGSVGRLFVHFLLTIVLAGVFFAKGELLAAGMRRFGVRLAGSRGDQVVVLAAHGVRAVAVGVVVTAFVQSLVGGVGLLVAGVPRAGLWAAIMLLSSLAQIGAAPVLAGAAVWLLANDHVGFGVAMIAWTALVGSLDNFIRPWLIQRGLDLPLVLLFAGVLGGLFAFGPVGLFVGPVVLAVGYTLLGAWLDEAEVAAEPAGIL